MIMPDDDRDSDAPKPATVLLFTPKAPTGLPPKHADATVPALLAEELIETAQMALQLARNLLRSVEKVAPVLREDGREVTIAFADGTHSVSFEDHACQVREVTIPHLEATLHFQHDVVRALQTSTYTDEWYNRRLQEFHEQLPVTIRPLGAD